VQLPEELPEQAADKQALAGLPAGQAEVQAADIQVPAASQAQLPEHLQLFRKPCKTFRYLLLEHRNWNKTYRFSFLNIKSVLAYACCSNY
jgi:hypothetical protein